MSAGLKSNTHFPESENFFLWTCVELCSKTRASVVDWWPACYIWPAGWHHLASTFRSGTSVAFGKLLLVNSGKMFLLYSDAIVTINWMQKGQNRARGVIKAEGLLYKVESLVTLRYHLKVVGSVQ